LIVEITKKPDPKYDTTVNMDSLLSAIESMKQKGARFITITAKDLDETNAEVLYHFEVEDHVETIHLIAKKSEPINSITSIYLDRVKPLNAAEAR